MEKDCNVQAINAAPTLVRRPCVSGDFLAGHSTPTPAALALRLHSRTPWTCHRRLGPPPALLFSLSHMLFFLAASPMVSMQPPLRRALPSRTLLLYGVVLMALTCLVASIIWAISPTALAPFAYSPAKPVLCVQGSSSREGIASSLMSYVYGIALADYYGLELRAVPKPSKHGYDSVEELGFGHCDSRTGGACDITEWAQGVQKEIMAAYVNMSKAPVPMPFRPGGTAEPGSAALDCRTLYFTRDKAVPFSYMFKRFIPALLHKPRCPPYADRVRLGHFQWVIIHEREGDLAAAHELGFRDSKSIGRAVSQAIIRRLVSCCAHPNVIFVNEHMEAVNAQTRTYHFRVANNSSPMAALRSIPCATAIFSGNGGFSRLIAAAGDVQYHFGTEPLSPTASEGWGVEASYNILTDFLNSSTCETVWAKTNCVPRLPGVPSKAGDIHDILYAAEAAAAPAGMVPAVE